MKKQANTEEGIPLTPIGKVSAKTQLINYQYFRQLFVKSLSDFDILVDRFDAVEHKYFTSKWNYGTFLRIKNI